MKLIFRGFVPLGGPIKLPLRGNVTLGGPYKTNFHCRNLHRTISYENTGQISKANSSPLISQTTLKSQTELRICLIEHR